MDWPVHLGVMEDALVIVTPVVLLHVVDVEDVLMDAPTVVVAIAIIILVLTDVIRDVTSVPVTAEVVCGPKNAVAVVIVNRTAMIAVQDATVVVEHVLAIVLEIVVTYVLTVVGVVILDVVDALVIVYPVVLVPPMQAKLQYNKVRCLSTLLIFILFVYFLCC